MRRCRAKAVAAHECSNQISEENAPIAFCLHMAQTSRTAYVRNQFMQFANDRMVCEQSARIGGTEFGLRKSGFA